MRPRGAGYRRYPRAVIAHRDEVAERARERRRQHERDPEGGVAAAPRFAKLRQEQERNASHAERGGGKEPRLHRNAERDPHADRRHEHDRRVDDRHEARHDDALGPVDEVVVEADHREADAREERVVAQREAQRPPRHGAAEREQRRRRGETIGDRHFRRNGAELQGDRVPGRAPDEHGHEEQRRDAHPSRAFGHGGSGH